MEVWVIGALLFAGIVAYFVILIRLAEWRRSAKLRRKDEQRHAEQLEWRRSGRLPPRWGDLLAAALRQALHAPAWALWLALVLAGAMVLRYGLLAALRWLIWIPRMARSRVAYAVLPPADFAPSGETIAAFTADL